MLGGKVFGCDFSEIDGFDNLSTPKGPIKSMQEKTTEIYGSEKTFYLTNGSTSGILALMLAVLKPGDKVLINRNCHSSVYNGLVLTGACPVWIDVEIDSDWDIIKPVNIYGVERGIRENPGLKALIITNPTYEGLTADIEPIAQVCRRFNITLIVDEAHGALWNFCAAFPKTAIECGADASVQSLHKSAGALNPAALLHIAKNSLIQPDKVQQALNLINTTSPSYPVLLDIEVTIDFLSSVDGAKYILQLLKNIAAFHKELLQRENIRVYCYGNDMTKILVQIDGMSGFMLADYLHQEHNLEVEIANDKSVLCLTGIGTTKRKLNKLKNAILKISRKQNLEPIIETGLCPATPRANEKYRTLSDAENEMKDSLKGKNTAKYLKPILTCTPQRAYYANYAEIKPDQAIGCTAKSMHLTYPPGIPVLIAGEVIQEGHLEYLKQHHDKIKVIV